MRTEKGGAKKISKTLCILKFLRKITFNFLNAQQEHNGFIFQARGEPPSPNFVCPNAQRQIIVRWCPFAPQNCGGGGAQPKMANWLGLGLRVSTYPDDWEWNTLTPWRSLSSVLSHYSGEKTDCNHWHVVIT